MSAQTTTVQRLRNQLRELESVRQRAPDTAKFSTGIAALDDLLPSCGIESGTLTEWLAGEPGSLAGILSLFTLRGIVAAPGAHAALIDAQGEISPMACAGWGVDLNRLLIVHPASNQETWWTVEQCLRSKGIQAVWAQLQDVPERVFRRWLLAAETGGGVGIFLRPERVRDAPAWSHIRWAVHLVPGAGISGHRLEIELLACRHGTSGQRVLVDLDHATSSVRVVSELERAASPVAATGS